MAPTQQTKLTWYLLVVFGLLIAGMLIYNYTRLAERTTEEEQRQIFSEISKDSINHITINFDQSETILVKREDIWYVEADNFKAEEGLLNTLFDTLASTSIASLASENSNKAADFAVDEEQGTKVVLAAGDQEKMNFIVGKNGPDYSSSYLKFSDRDSIYLVDQDLTTVFQVKDFRELRLSSVSSTDIQKITLIHPDNSFSLVREEDRWLWEQSRETTLDQDEVRNLVNRAANLRADSIPEQDMEAGFDAPLLTIKLEGPGVAEELVIGKKQEEGYFAKNKDNTLYLLAEDNFTDISRKIEDLQEKEDK